MPDATTYIQFDRVNKNFGTVAAVKNVSLDIAQGEFFSLLGPSGCGKTTLLRILSGLEFPTSGCVMVDGADISTLPPHRRPTNMVFQSYAIFPHLTVAENIAYGLRRLGLERKQRETRIGEMLELMGLQGFAARRPNQLSGGQLQRIALARALILHPKVLLLDEPLAALDKKLRERMQIELRSIQREVGITFVFVTHDQEEALTLSDRVGVMSGGHLLQCSSPKDLYERPVSREVAEFVGEMNLLEGKILTSGSDFVDVDVESFGAVRFPKPKFSARTGQKVRVALRPEWLIFGSASAYSRRCEILGQSYFGTHSHLSVMITESRRTLTIAVLNGVDTGSMNSAEVSFRAERALLLSD